MKAASRRLIALDTSFIVALRGGDGVEARERAEQVLEMHANDTLVLPVPALAECLPGVLPPGLGSIDMNASAAAIAARLKGAVKSRPKPLTKREASIDLMILATAEAHGAERIYALDGVFEAVASGHGLTVRVMGLPPRKAIQMTLTPLKPRDPADEG